MFPPALKVALHVGLITPREMKLFFLNLAQFDSWSQGSFLAMGSPDLLDGPLEGWKRSALALTLMHRRCDYPNAAQLLLCHYAPLPMGFLIQSSSLWAKTPMSATVGRDCHLQLFPTCKCHDLCCKSEFSYSSPSLVPSVFIGIIKQIFTSELLKANLRFFHLQSSENEGGDGCDPRQRQQPGGVPRELSLCRGWRVLGVHGNELSKVREEIGAGRKKEKQVDGITWWI